MIKTVADVLAETLVEAGVKVVFGLPGGENTEVLDAMRRQGIEFVLVHNESSAVFMADANARLSGITGVCLTTLGPGATNACVGVAHTFLERSPVLIITAQSIDRLIGRHTHQVIDINALFAPITKSTDRLTSRTTRETARFALALTMAGRPGPVHLSISSEEATKPAENDVAGPWVPARALRDVPIEADLARARVMLRAARRPVIVAGLGLEPEKPYAELRRMAESLDAPVIVTPKAKGAIPDDHRLSIGTIGLTRADPVYTILDEADCIVAVGFDVVELVRPWDASQPLIWIASWPNEDPPIAADVILVGTIAPTLHQLMEDLPRSASGWGTARSAAFRDELGRMTLQAPTPGCMRPQSVLAAIRAATPRNVLITTDVGSHKILTALEWPAYEPNCYLVSNGLSAMGYGLTSAIAAAHTLHQPAVAITGDAGIAMVMGELGLLRRLNLPVIVVVMNDRVLDLIRSAQVRGGKPVYGTEFLNPNFANIATAYGIDYFQVADERAATQAVRAAMASGQPTLIDALIDPTSYPTTPRPQ